MTPVCNQNRALIKALMAEGLDARRSGSQRLTGVEAGKIELDKTPANPQTNTQKDKLHRPTQAMRPGFLAQTEWLADGRYRCARLFSVSWPMQICVFFAVTFHGRNHIFRYEYGSFMKTAP